MSRRTEISITLIGVFIALMTLLFGDNVYFQIAGRSLGEDFRNFFSQEPAITAIANTSISSPTPTNKAPELSNPSVLFDENFEDGRAQGFYYISGNWEIKEDDTGNKFYEIDNTGVSGFSSKLKFGSISWEDYEIHLRVKMLNLIGNAVPQFLVYFKADENDSGYVLNLQPSSEVADLVPVVSGQWQNGISRHYKYSVNTWYDIRIIAQETQIQVYINNKLVSDGDAQAKSGNIGIDIGPGARIQLDDIKIIKIEK